MPALEFCNRFFYIFLFNLNWLYITFHSYYCTEAALQRIILYEWDKIWDFILYAYGFILVLF